MIEVKSLKKSFDEKIVFENMTVKIKDNSIFGLVGINGSGKSTFLRILSGVYQQNEGTVLIDGESPSKNVRIKNNLFYLNDDPYIPNRITVKEMLAFYKTVYEIDEQKFYEILKVFNLKLDGKLSKFSKGMKRQFFLAIALSLKVKYLLIDEAFDGLDPLAKLKVRGMLQDFISKGNNSVIITSHSLRELQDICSYFGMIKEGKFELLDEVKDSYEDGLHKFQVLFKEQEIYEDKNVKKHYSVGKIHYYIVNGKSEEFYGKINKLEPILCEEIPMSYEEIFVVKNKQEGE